MKGHINVPRYPDKENDLLKMCLAMMVEGVDFTIVHPNAKDAERFAKKLRALGDCWRNNENLD